MRPCPTIEELEAYLGDEKSHPGVPAHLDDCVSCRQTLELVRANDELLAGVLRPMRAELAADLGYAERDAVEGYEIQDRIGGGGQGVVYRAVQKSTKRTVALKVLMEGPVDSAGSLRRFEREVELIASLRHPGIVTLYDSGVLTDGRHFFAMEHVQGMTLNQFLRSRGAPGFAGGSEELTSWTRTRTLKLFADICSAVSYAHQNTVIHRDLKPSNILIDDHGAPHVLDFGLAKELGTASHDEGLTRSNEFMGTLAYASPEQVSGTSSSVDTRTDVYSLGVILYEMLTGRSPYPETRGMAELVRAISTQDPTPPSSCIERAGTHQPIRSRRADSIDQDIDTIVLKALAKDRERRYQSAGDLGRDVEHHLAGEPIDARRDSTWYVLKKHVRRHRIPVAAAALLLLVIVGSSVGMGFLWRQAEASAVRERASAQREKHEADVTRSAVRFVHEMLASVHPDFALGEEPTVREMLDRAAERIEAEVGDQPMLEADVRLIVGDAYLGIDREGDARAHLSRALELRLELFGEESEGVAEAKQKLAQCARQEGRYDEAAELYREAIEAMRAIDSEEHWITALAAHGLAQTLLETGELDTAEDLFVEVIDLQRRVLGERDPQYAIAVQGLGDLYLARGEFERAEEQLRTALEIRRGIGQTERLSLAHNLRNLADNLFVQGEYGAGLSYIEESRAILLHLLGEDHPRSLATTIQHALFLQRLGRAEESQALYESSLAARAVLEERPSPVSVGALNSLGVLAQGFGDLDAAASLYRSCLEIGEALGLGSSPDRATTRINLVSVLVNRGQYAEAEPLCRDIVASLRARDDRGGAGLAPALYNLALCRMHAEDFAESEALASEALESMTRFHGERNPKSGVYLLCLGWIVYKRGHYDEAEALLRQALEHLREFHPETSSRVRRGLSYLMAVLEAAGNFEAAGALAGELLEQYLAERGELDPNVARAQIGLGRNLAHLHRFDEARPLLERALETLLDTRGDRSSEVFQAREALALWHREKGELGEAKRLYSEAVELARDLYGPDHVNVALAEFGLARVLLASGDEDGAVRLLEHCHSTFETRRGPDHPRTSEMRALLGSMRAGAVSAPNSEGK